MVTFKIKSEKSGDSVYAHVSWEDSVSGESVSVGTIAFPDLRVYDDFVTLIKDGAGIGSGVELMISTEV